MKTFTIVEKVEAVSVNKYHVQAESIEEAGEKFLNELAGELPLIDSYVEYPSVENLKYVAMEVQDGHEKLNLLD